MARMRRASGKRSSRDPLQPIRELQKQLEDSEGAKCLAAKTTEGYKEGVLCGSPAEARRHTISNSAYLTEMSEDGLVLSTLPIDASHIAHYTLMDSLKARSGQLHVARLRPKPTSLNDASTWHFACQEHDASFGPIDRRIAFPSSHEYMRITTEELDETMKPLENALFLMAYRSLLSSLSIFRGLRNTLVALKLQKGNLPEIRRQMTDVSVSQNKMMKGKRRYDGRFAGVLDCNMIHHLIAAEPHTRLAMSKVMTFGIVNVLPGNDISRIVVSHLADGREKDEREAAEWIANAAKALSDHSDRKSFVGLISGTFEAYVSPTDYKGWSEMEKNVLEEDAAVSINELFDKYNSKARRRILFKR